MLRLLLQESFDIHNNHHEKMTKALTNVHLRQSKMEKMVSVRSVSHAPVFVWLIKLRRMKLVNNFTSINVMGDK